jgi:uncharacterized protein (DUF2141 family)
MYRIFQVSVLLLAAVVLSCARISSPTGGPKDKTPPVVVESKPENGTKWFKAKSFEITFDEYVVLDKITDKFMVSPPLKKKPDISLKGKTLIVKWDEDLAENTTYTFYFQDAIKDNDEGNVLNNFQYCFSTGSVLDSLSFSGNVYNAENLEAAQDALVLLYSNLADTAPSKALADYLTKPDLSGGFCINHIKPGDYRVYALGDLNGNRMYDGGDETFAFNDSVISITARNFYDLKLDSIKRLPEKPKDQEKKGTKTAKPKPDIYTVGRYPLYLYQAEKTNQYLTSSERKSAGAITFTLALPADTSKFSFKIVGESDSAWYMEENRTRDTFNIWIRDSLVYSKSMLKGLIKFPFTDSTKKTVYKTDTVRMNFGTRVAPLRRAKAKKVAVLSPLFGSQIKPGATLSFIGISPLLMPDTSKMYFEQTIDTVHTRLKPHFVSPKGNSRGLYVTNKLVPGASYTLVCLKRAFKDIYGNTNDSIAFKVKVGKDDDYGKINANIFGYNGNIIVQLLDDKEKVVSQKADVSPCKVVFPLINNGKYRLRVIYDINGDGKWTTGNFAKKQQPEPVSYYPKVLDVKINWEIDQDWDISTKDSKSIELRGKPEAKAKSSSQ